MQLLLPNNICTIYSFVSESEVNTYISDQAPGNYRDKTAHSVACMHSSTVVSRKIIKPVK